MNGNGFSDDNAAALQVLEEFVVNNDELLELEERIGRFNIFDALRVERVEIRHSNFLAWLLDPAESHGQGALFLKAILMDLLSQTPPDQRPFSPVELDGVDLRGVEIRREWRHIDLLVLCKEPAFVIVIENKVRSGEHGDQLENYRKIVEEQFPELPCQYVYLTIEGDEPSHKYWGVYTYADIHRVLSRVRRANESAIGEDVLVFLDHYLRLIGSRFMDDKKIDELCRTIYHNHRQAMQLIFDRVGSPMAGLLAELQEVLESEPSQWHIFNRTSKRIDFVPKSWTEWIPPICARPRWHSQMWIRWWVHCGTKSCSLIVEVGPAKDIQLRQQIIERLTQSPGEFGMKVSGKHTEKWTRLRREAVAKWEQDSEPDSEKVVANFRKKLQKLSDELKAVAPALKPILQSWNEKAHTE